MMLALGCGTPPSRLAKSHTPASAGTALVSEAPELRLTGCPANCSGHGTCAGGQCYCAGGWAGVQCQQLAVAGCPLNCSGHGSCNHRTMLCVCAEYFAGVACEAAVPSCPNFCSHAGHCVDGACRCEPGRVGSDCAQLQLASAACPDDCGTSERGTCVAGACHCIAPAIAYADTYSNAPGLLSVRVRTDYAYQPPACCTYPRRGAAWPGEVPTARTVLRSRLRAPASGVPYSTLRTMSTSHTYHVPYVPCTVAPQATGASCAESTDPKTCPGACSAHGACDTATGQCTCDADWTGGMCELLVAQAC